MLDHDPDGNQNSYDRFSLFYRELIAVTGRLEAEKSLLDGLVHQLNISVDAFILDAACGTGDALAHLVHRGFVHLYGSDGSSGMLERAKRLVPGVPVLRIPWTELHTSEFERAGGFDVIYLISLSLPHAEGEDIPHILQSLHNLLRPGGRLIFDTRAWETDPNGCLRESNRPSGCTRTLGNISTLERRWRVTDRCDYTHDRQIVVYNIRALGDEKFSYEFCVSYALLTADQLTAKLQEVGFIRIDRLLFDFWPYIVLVAEKARNSNAA